MKLTDPPGSGIYQDVPFELYQSWNAVSTSWLHKLSDSPATLRDYLTNGAGEDESGTAKEIGTAVHCAVLEPGEFAKRYILPGPCAATMKSGKRKGRPCGAAGFTKIEGIWTCSRHTPPDMEPLENVLEETSWRWCQAIAERVRESQRAAAMLEGGLKEVSIVGEIGGLVCKGRVDLLHSGGLADLKTTIKTRSEFTAEIFRRHYHAQAWFYLELGRSLGYPWNDYTIIAAHKRRPFLVSYHALGPAALELGERYCLPLLNLYDWCQRQHCWPGYDDNPVPAEPPAWALAGHPLEEEPFDA